MGTCLDGGRGLQSRDHGCDVGSLCHIRGTEVYWSLVAIGLNREGGK